MTKSVRVAPDGAVVQVAYLVEDLSQAAARFSETTGAGPFFVADHVPVTPVAGVMDIAGDAGLFDHSCALGQWGQLMVELIEYHSVAPDSLRAALTRRSPGLHHVACFATDHAEHIARLQREGGVLILEAVTGAGVRFAFMDDPLAGLIEVYERSDRILSVYERVAAAAYGWDRTDVVRPIERLEEVLSVQPPSTSLHVEGSAR